MIKKINTYKKQQKQTNKQTHIFVTSGYISTFSFATTYYNISNYERNL